MSERIGDWIQTYTGKRFYPLDPRCEDIDIEDIAHALSNQCRFSGHVREFYSVAEHCVRVEGFLAESGICCEPALLLKALLHDASEAYLVDLPRPIKRFSGMTAYREAEAVLSFRINDKFGVTSLDNEQIKFADGVMLGAEAICLMPGSGAEWDDKSLLLEANRWRSMGLNSVRISSPLYPKSAKASFLARFDALSRQLREKCKP